MPYDFTLRVASKAAAIEAATAQIDGAIVDQPLHAHDRGAVLGALQAHLDLVRDPVGGEEISVAVRAFISDTGGAGVVGAGVTISAVVVTAAMKVPGVDQQTMP